MQKIKVASAHVLSLFFVQPLKGFMYSVAPESMCSNSSLKFTVVQGLLVFQIPDHLNCTNFTLLAEHDCTEGTITVNINDITSSVNNMSNCLCFCNKPNILQ